jgi:DNA (cytosine-5)-methyltransferase 1
MNSSKKRETFKFIDLFAGIGGFHLGLESAGCICVYANEWDPYSATTYSTWFPETYLDQRDLSSVNFSSEIPRHDVLAAGFPCQPFSLAGVSKKNSLGQKHGFADKKQGNLFLEICKIVESRKPNVVFLENVKNLISHDSGNTWRKIQYQLDNLGYQVHWKVIDAKSWVPQHRERIYIVAFRRRTFTKREIDSFSFPKGRHSNLRLSQILESHPAKKYMLSDSLWKYLQMYASKHKALGNGFGFSIAKPSEVSRTLSARYYKDGSEILVRQRGWKNPRKITPHEASLLMGFDDSWRRKLGKRFPQVVSDTQAYKQFGNAVCPKVIEAISREILKVLVMRNERLGR